ncbi:MAG: recombination protein RecR [Kiritimatiellae bacterium]|nr:recombination protein RecR [Kiritimatiellia bacterium]
MEREYERVVKTSPNEPLAELAACLSRLPGVGSRSAERMALKLAREPDGLLKRLAAALKSVGETVRCCTRCGSLTSAGQEPCRLCTDPGRDGAVVCVVEDPNDIPTIEKSGGFRGRYHALMGRISAMQGTGPEDLEIRKLLKRIEEEGFREVILALNTNTESDATAAMLARLLAARNVRVTRLAFGLPAGSGIAYVDPVTLERAIRGRQPLA